MCRPTKFGAFQICITCFLEKIAEFVLQFEFLSSGQLPVSSFPHFESTLIAGKAGWPRRIRWRLS